MVWYWWNCWLFKFVFHHLLKWKIKYHTVGTILKSNNNIVERGKIDPPLAHEYMTAHFPGLRKGGGVKLIIRVKNSLLAKWYSNESCSTSILVYMYIHERYESYCFLNLVLNVYMMSNCSKQTNLTDQNSLTITQRFK